MRTKQRAVAGAVGAALIAALFWGTGKPPGELDDQELAGLWGGRAPSSYCNPYPACSGAVVYCSDAIPGAFVGDPCTPAVAVTYYNPEYCSDTPNTPQCGQTAMVTVYCKTETECVTSFQGGQKVCTAGSVLDTVTTIVTDRSRCRNLTVFENTPP